MLVFVIFKRIHFLRKLLLLFYNQNLHIQDPYLLFFKNKKVSLHCFLKITYLRVKIRICIHKTFYLLFFP